MLSGRGRRFGVWLARFSISALCRPYPAASYYSNSMRCVTSSALLPWQERSNATLLSSQWILKEEEHSCNNDCLALNFASCLYRYRCCCCQLLVACSQRMLVSLAQAFSVALGAIQVQVVMVQLCRLQLRPRQTPTDKVIIKLCSVLCVCYSIIYFTAGSLSWESELRVRVES